MTGDTESEQEAFADVKLPMLLKCLKWVKASQIDLTLVYSFLWESWYTLMEFCMRWKRILPSY